MQNDVDIIIGGGGVAGTAAAAALHQLGYRVVLVEPGQHDKLRLAGELFHPPGVTGLAELGLLPALLDAPLKRIKGFLVSSAADDGRSIRLPYDEVGAHATSGIGLEHSVIRHQLMQAVEAMGITVLHGTRVIAIDQDDPSCVAVTVANGSASATRQYRCRLVIAADGAQSRMARSVGIAIHQRRISTLFGYRIAGGDLPDFDYGQVILGAAAPVLVYPISSTEARVLFDIPHAPGRLPQAADCVEIGSVLPAWLRPAAHQAIAAQAQMSVFASAVTIDRLVEDRVVLVGDAAGACHPLTASGMTRCIDDALLLRDAIAEARAISNGRCMTIRGAGAGPRPPASHWPTRCATPSAARPPRRASCSAASSATVAPARAGAPRPWRCCPPRKDVPWCCCAKSSWWRSADISDIFARPSHPTRAGPRHTG